MTAARSIRSLTPPEIEALVAWAADEGWNPGLADAAPFVAADPDGYLGAFVGGEMVSGISAVSYGAPFGFIGLYITRPAWRGQGHGKAVWDAGMARLGRRTIGLDGVPAQQANYGRMGFSVAHRTARYSGVPAGGGRRDPRLRPVDDALVPAVLAYDLDCFPAARTGFLRAWLSPPRIALALLEDGRMQGYGVARQCGEGWKVGPLFADGTDAADALLAGLAARLPGEALHLDVPARQEAFAARLLAEGLSPGFETARMYKGEPPRIAEERVFGITTLELG